MNISTGVVHRHLQKLADLDWIDKDAYGRYTVKKKVGFKGYVWFKYLLPRSFLFAFAFLALAIVWLIVLGIHVAGVTNRSIILGINCRYSFSGCVIIIESFRPRKRLPTKLN